MRVRAAVVGDGAGQTHQASKRRRSMGAQRSLEKIALPLKRYRVPSRIGYSLHQLNLLWKDMAS